MLASSVYLMPRLQWNRVVRSRTCFTLFREHISIVTGRLPWLFRHVVGTGLLWDPKEPSDLLCYPVNTEDPCGQLVNTDELVVGDLKHTAQLIRRAPQTCRLSSNNTRLSTFCTEWRTIRSNFHFRNRSSSVLRDFYYLPVPWCIFFCSFVLSSFFFQVNFE